MRWLMLAVLTLPALAGCLSTTIEDPAPANGSEMTMPELAFLPSVDLVCTTPTRVNACGSFGEPALEVAGDGTIWYSAVETVGASPPIWTSRDGGETFQELEFLDGTGAVRDATGIEGDFAIDDAGNVYFFDILAATTYFTKYQADETHVFTAPQPQIPLVDRPWVRAGAEDEVFIFYNTAAAGTNFLRSTTGGLVWDYAGMVNFPCPLAAMGQGPERDDLLLGGCPGAPMVWISDNGGVSFDRQIDLPLPEGWSVRDNYLQPSMDASGRAYVPIAAQNSSGDSSFNAVYIVETDDTVRGPFLASSGEGLVDKPWSIAGKDGVYAMAYYASQTGTRMDSSEAVWFLEIAYTLNGEAENPTWHRAIADPDVLLTGEFGRNLGDFLQLRQTPEGRLAVAYAYRGDEGLVNRFVQSELGIDFGPEVFRNGPLPA